MTPVANLEPVLLAGTTVRACDAAQCRTDRAARYPARRHGLCGKGRRDHPQDYGRRSVRSVRPTASRSSSSPHCPECGTPNWCNTRARRSHYCPNPEPLSAADRRPHHPFHLAARRWTSTGWARRPCELLYDNGLVHDVADLYDLKARTAGRNLPRLGEKSADNIIRSIRGSVEVPFRRVLFATRHPLRGRDDGQIPRRAFPLARRRDAGHARGAGPGRRGGRPQVADAHSSTTSPTSGNRTPSSARLRAAPG